MAEEILISHWICFLPLALNIVLTKSLSFCLLILTQKSEARFKNLLAQWDRVTTDLPSSLVSQKRGISFIAPNQKGLSHLKEPPSYFLCVFLFSRLPLSDYFLSTTWRLHLLTQGWFYFIDTNTNFWFTVQSYILQHKTVYICFTVFNNSWKNNLNNQFVMQFWKLNRMTDFRHSDTTNEKRYFSP